MTLGIDFSVYTHLRLWGLNEKALSRGRGLGEGKSK